MSIVTIPSSTETPSRLVGQEVLPVPRAPVGRGSAGSPSSGEVTGHQRPGSGSSRVVGLGRVDVVKRSGRSRAGLPCGGSGTRNSIPELRSGRSWRANQTSKPSVGGPETSGWASCGALADGAPPPLLSPKYTPTPARARASTPRVPAASAAGSLACFFDQRLGIVRLVATGARFLDQRLERQSGSPESWITSGADGRGGVVTVIELSSISDAIVGSTMRIVKVDHSDSLELHHQVAAEIRRAIAEGEAKQGERLPPAKDLAAVLGVNANTVLRALRDLRDEGLLEFRRGRGSRSPVRRNAARS